MDKKIDWPDTQLDVLAMPDVLMVGSGNKRRPSTQQRATLGNFGYLLDARGVELAWDVMRGVPVARFDGEIYPGDGHQFATIRTHLLNDCVRLGIPTNKLLDEYLTLLARRDQYHPVDQWLSSLDPWTEGDRDYIDELAATVGTGTGLWRVYLCKWLIQCCEAVCGWPEMDPTRSVPHILMLIGEQGAGKSTWLRTIGEALGVGAYKGDMALHLGGGDRKDAMLNVLCYAVVELAEIDTTFKRSEVGALKNFLSATEDRIRAPYAATSISRRRCTSFCGTGNDPEMLNDDTGSRRIWSVSVDHIDLDALAQIDMAAVWAQAYELWREGSVGYWLTAEEEAARALSNEDFSTEHMATTEVLEFFTEERMGRPQDTWLPVSVVTMGKLLGLNNKDISHPLTQKGLSVGLRKLFGKRRSRVLGVRRCWVVPVSATEFATHGLAAPGRSLRAADE